MALTVMDAAEIEVTTKMTMTSFALVVVAVIVNEEPEDHTPVALPSDPNVPYDGFG